MEPSPATPDAAVTPPGADAPGSPAPPSDAQLQELDKVQELEDKIIGVFKSVYDPEVPANIYELGLIYGVEVQPDGVVKVEMTLTTPGCPTAASLVGEVQRKVAALPGVKSAEVNLVWSPPWTPARMTEAARLQLGIFD
jgi:FeS assembly SUF system protein